MYMHRKRKDCERCIFPFERKGGGREGGRKGGSGRGERETITYMEKRKGEHKQSAAIEESEGGREGRWEEKKNEGIYGHRTGKQVL